MLAPPRTFIQKAHSFSITEEMQEREKNRKQLYKRVAKKKKKDKINFAELLNMEVLKEIRREFLCRCDGNSVPCEEFCEVLSLYIPPSDVQSLYKKIDVNDDGMVECKISGLYIIYMIIIWCLLHSIVLVHHVQGTNSQTS